ncbi:MAG: sulfite exporter TauE/SafE family protein [Oscillospiraceae bacterium]|nr:sulfite exporter TauE/SafE family protein [Oscillospiraceae bacterium]
MNRKKKILGGVGIGLANGLLGSGGGMIAVPVLRHEMDSSKAVHATSIAVIAPLCLFSAAISLWGGRVALSDALPYIPAGVIGAVAGCLLMNKISGNLLRRIFGAFAIWAGLRLLLR